MGFTNPQDTAYKNGEMNVGMKKGMQTENSKIKADNPLIENIYACLFDLYGPQGWWPLTDLYETKEKIPAKTGSLQGYHLSDYTYPRTGAQGFEIICGAILTQNTNWKQVEKALLNLKQIQAFSPEGILSLPSEILKEAIRPAGYYNQKATRLVTLANWFIELKDRIPTREELLSLKGVGPETADSILLYAFKQPSFVVDAYTRRIVTNVGFIGEKASYEEIKKLFEENLPLDFKIYQEYHALLVEHAKRYYKKKGSNTGCLLLDLIQK